MAYAVNMTIESCRAGDGESSRRYNLYMLLVIMVLAMGLRLMQWHLIDSLYRDSVNFIIHAERFSTESLQHLIQEPVHPMLLRGIHAVLFPAEVPAKAIDVASWELTVFVNGIFFTLICLWLLFAIGRYLHSPEAGLWAAFFLAILPYGVEYSINGLSELPFVAMLLACVYLVMKSGETNGKWQVLTAGILAGILILARKEGFILIPIVMIYLLCRRDLKILDRVKLTMFFLFGAGGMLGIYYLVGGQFYWFSEYVKTLRKLANRNFSKQACMEGEQLILALHWIGKKYEFAIMPVTGWFKLSGFIPAILVLTYLFKRHRIKVNAGVGLLFLYALVHFTMVCAQTILTKYFVTRYLFPVCIILFPVAGVMMAEILGRIHLKFKESGRYSHIGLIIAIIMTAVFAGEIFQNGMTGRHSEVLSASLWLKANTPQKAIIFVTDDRVGFYSQRHWRNVVTHRLAGEILALPKFQDVTYLAISYKEREKGYVQLNLNHLQQRRNIQADVVQTFSDKKNKVTIYELKTNARSGGSEPTTSPKR
jgi:hypothetical protein